MKVLIIGLGKMGGNMARRWLRSGHTVIGFDNNPESAHVIQKEDGLIPASNLKEGVALLDSPRVVWVMVPSGEITRTTIIQVAEHLQSGDIVVDGGNSNFNESINTAQALKEMGIDFLDAGVSGGVWGLNEGYSIMVGGDRQAYETIKPLVRSLAPGEDIGWGWVGPSGAGHYVKMVHNGIEYGMMEAYAEGYELMQSRKDMNLDMHQISRIWQHSSVVRSWLLDLIVRALEEDQSLDSIQPWVSDSGEGRWTIKEAIDQDVPVPVMTAALFRRFESRQENSYAFRLLSAIRNQFGGHPMKMVK
ncbi:MAG: decarboxylating 6-phosphogluconate dehydrogenase [Leptolinea sp.]|nr:decarboxylating 6-phosphogluconate dehydrogenase [Leptolinea sp.]